MKWYNWVGLFLVLSPILTLLGAVWYVEGWQFLLIALSLILGLVGILAGGMYLATK